MPSPSGSPGPLADQKGSPQWFRRDGQPKKAAPSSHPGPGSKHGPSRSAARLIGQELGSNVAAQTQVFGLVDHTYAAATQLLQNTVVGNGLADHGGTHPWAIILAAGEMSHWVTTLPDCARRTRIGHSRLTCVNPAWWPKVTATPRTLKRNGRTFSPTWCPPTPAQRRRRPTERQVRRRVLFGLIFLAERGRLALHRR